MSEKESSGLENLENKCLLIVMIINICLFFYLSVSKHCNLIEPLVIWKVYTISEKLLRTIYEHF